MGKEWGPDGAAPRPARARVRAARQAWRLLHTRGTVQAYACGLCACLVVADGAEQHERHHLADGARTD